MTWEAYEHSIEVHRRLGEESLAERVFRKSVKTRENEGCKPTPASLLEDIRKHWNTGTVASTRYDVKNVISIDMKSCYPARGKVKVNHIAKGLGNPKTQNVNQGRMASDITTGIAKV